MIRDFGAGLTIDELVGMQAADIASFELPNEKCFTQLQSAANNLVCHDFEAYRLMELWGNGETVWMGADQTEVIIVSASGQILPQKG